MADKQEKKRRFVDGEKNEKKKPESSQDNFEDILQDVIPTPSFNNEDNTFIRDSFGLTNLTGEELQDKIRELKKEAFLKGIALGKVTLGMKNYVKRGVAGLIDYVLDSWNQACVVLGIAYSSNNKVLPYDDVTTLKRNQSQKEDDYFSYMVSKSDLLYVMILNMWAKHKGKYQKWTFDDFFRELSIQWNDKDVQEYKSVAKRVENKNGGHNILVPIYSKNDFEKVRHELVELWKDQVYVPDVKVEPKKVKIFKK